MSGHIYTQSEIFAVVRQLLKKYHAESAILFALVVHAMQTALIIALGMIGLMALQFTKRHSGNVSAVTDAK